MTTDAEELVVPDRPEPAKENLMPAIIDERVWQVRFLFPVLPLFNIGAAVAAARIASGRQRSAGACAAHTVCCCVLAMGFLVTLLMTAASRHNYPGGEAMHRVPSLATGWDCCHGG